MACLPQPQLPPQCLDQPLADRRPHVDQALLHHLDRVEQPLELLGGHAGRPRPHDDADVAVAFGIVLASDRQRHFRLLGRRVVGEIANQIRERFAQLDGVDLDELRGALRDDVKMEVLARRLVR